MTTPTTDTIEITIPRALAEHLRERGILHLTDAHIEALQRGATDATTSYDNGRRANLTTDEALTWHAILLAARRYNTMIAKEARHESPHHPMEHEEICHAFHAIQNWLAARPAIRLLNAATDPEVRPHQPR